MAKRVVVVGAGIGGAPAAYAVKSRMGADAAVTVIGKGPDFQFTPSNPWVALGWRSQADIEFPIAPYLAAQGIDFIPVPAHHVDAAQRRVVLTDDRVIDYDFLILATGAEANVDAVPGLSVQMNVHSVMRTEDAVRAHAAYREFVRNPGPVVIGATQGAGILGPVYELAFLIDADLRRRHLRRHVPITVVSPEPYPGHLGMGGDGEARRLLEQVLAASEIDFIGNAITKRAERDHLRLLIAESPPAGGARDLPYAYSVYWPAFRGVAALRHSPDLTDEHGRVSVDEYLRSRRHPQIFAVGLCVSRPLLTETSVPVGAPESVYAIQSEVDTVVQNVAASTANQPLASATPRRAQWISDLGESGARYLSQPHVPLRDVNWLRRGTWVPLAKTDFERHFVNKIKHGAARGPASGTHVAALVGQMESDRKVGERAEGERAAQQLRVPLSNEQTQELEALAHVLGRATESLAARLLQAAMQDAEASLGDTAREDLTPARREVLVDRVTGEEPGVHFQGGAP